MDEPTASLSVNETEELFKAIDRLKQKGFLSFLYPIDWKSNENM